MNKKLVVSASLLAKSQVASYTRSDGVVVQSHDNGRQAAAPKPAAAASRASARQQLEQSRQSKLKEKLSAGGSIEDGEAKAAGFKSASHATAKLGGSAAPKLAVRASAAKQAAAKTGSAAPAHTPNPHHSDLEEGDELLDEKGQKHEYSTTHRGIGRMQVEMRSGHRVPTGSDGKLAGWKKTGRNNVTGAGHEPHPAAAKTGSSAPAKMKNVGTDKRPLRAKSSDALGAKHPDGSTHHVGGFEPPVHGKGDHLIHHDGKTFSYSGKSGKNMKTGEASYEYRAGDSGEHRAWVTHSGHLMND